MHWFRPTGSAYRNYFFFYENTIILNIYNFGEIYNTRPMHL